jgi:hypothetical protein
LRERLLVWDPIGVTGWAEAEEEYDCLVSPLEHLLRDQESAAAMGYWLLVEMRDHFGMTPNEPRERALVADLDGVVGASDSRTRMTGAVAAPDRAISAGKHGSCQAGALFPHAADYGC